MTSYHPKKVDLPKVISIANVMEQIFIRKFISYLQLLHYVLF